MTTSPVGSDARLLAECMAHGALRYPETTPIPGSREEEIAVVWALVDALEESETDELGAAVSYMRRLPVSCQVSWASAMYGVIEGFRSGCGAERLGTSVHVHALRALMRDYLRILQSGSTDVPMVKGYADTNGVLNEFFPPAAAKLRAYETKVQTQLRTQTFELLHLQIKRDPQMAPVLEGRIQRQDALIMLARAADFSAEWRTTREALADWEYVQRMSAEEAELYADLMVGVLARDRAERIRASLPEELLAELRAAAERNALRRQQVHNYNGDYETGDSLGPSNDGNTGWTPGTNTGWTPGTDTGWTPGTDTGWTPGSDTGWTPGR